MPQVLQELLIAGGKGDAADDHVHHLRDRQYGGPQTPNRKGLLDCFEDGGMLGGSHSEAVGRDVRREEGEVAEGEDKSRKPAAVTPRRVQDLDSDW